MFFSFKDITFTMGANRQRRVTVSGSVDQGRVLVVRGASGTGKTTLLRTLARLTPSEEGEAFLMGRSWKEYSGTAWRSNVHYFSQRPVVFDGTVCLNMKKPFEAAAINKKTRFDPEEAKGILEELLLPRDIWNQDARTLSGGEIARVAFARALLAQPKVLLLDEPAAPLDAASREAFLKLLSRWLAGPERACILVSHTDEYQALEPVSFLDLTTTGEGV